MKKRSTPAIAPSPIDFIIVSSCSCRPAHHSMSRRVARDGITCWRAAMGVEGDVLRWTGSQPLLSERLLGTTNLQQGDISMPLDIRCRGLGAQAAKERSRRIGPGVAAAVIDAFRDRKRRPSVDILRIQLRTLVDQKLNECVGAAVSPICRSV